MRGGVSALKGFCCRTSKAGCLLGSFEYASLTDRDVSFSSEIISLLKSFHIPI